ncbi:Guanine nucleotide-exchange factor S12 [Scheffersomyces spartinae]|uniref:Guanine nucleotide-exchange factor SEC12 n=1 Tax=Scheffersomyces spartinae TaxID=45513 RepID=A0A9P8AJE3_9ASCO|nr:Guanine nucleotide-exchange factor S12 [Scheffersomyces spartinae]KAG7194671.1 Guanine nucleotide-exchange factor S12 [Scheffersomyces spartinae]
MAIKETSVISVGYPILATKFINNKTILVIGGGGEGNNGVPNKITAIKCSFKVTDKSRILQRFREITLPSNEDSPQCVDIIRTLDSDEKSYGVYVGCNQSSQLMLSMGINNNLRKYSFTHEEHLRFLDAAQMEPTTPGIDDFPKIVRLSPHGTVGCLMTSTVPSSIYVFNPDSLDLIHKLKPTPDQEIKDFTLDTNDDEGNVMAYITSKSIETVITKTGQSIFSSSKLKNKNQLEMYSLAKVRFSQTGQELIIAGTNKKDKSAVVILYSLKLGKIIRTSKVSKKFGVIGAMDVSFAANLIAVAGNNLSVVLIRLSDLKVIETFEQLHPFAITDVAFSPNGHKLASVSAAQTLHVMKIPPKYAKGKSTIGTVFGYLFTIIFMAIAAFLIQAAYDGGELDQLIALSQQYSKEWGKLSKDFSMDISKEWWTHSKQWSEVGIVYANDYGHKGWKLAQVYGKVGLQYSKKGLALADVYAHRGIDIIKEKLKKDKVSDNDEDFFKVDDWDAKTHEITGKDDTYMKVETNTPSSEEIEQEQGFKYETTVLDDVSIQRMTKDIHEYTKDNQSIDTESLLNNPDIYETKIVTKAASSIELVEPSQIASDPVESVSSELKTETIVESSFEVKSETTIESIASIESSTAHEESTVSKKSINAEVSATVVSQKPVASKVPIESVVSEAVESVVSKAVDSVVSEKPIESPVYEERIDSKVSEEPSSTETTSTDSTVNVSSSSISIEVEKYPDINEPIDVNTKLDKEVKDFSKRVEVEESNISEGTSASEIEQESSVTSSKVERIVEDSSTESVSTKIPELSTVEVQSTASEKSEPELESTSSTTETVATESVPRESSVVDPAIEVESVEKASQASISAIVDDPQPYMYNPETVEEDTETSISSESTIEAVESQHSSSPSEPSKLLSETSSSPSEETSRSSEPSTSLPSSSPSEETSSSSSEETSSSSSEETSSSSSEETSSSSSEETSSSSSEETSSSSSEETSSSPSEETSRSSEPSTSLPSSSSQDKFEREQTSSSQTEASVPPVSSEEKELSTTPTIEYSSLTVVETLRETQTNAQGQRQVIHKVITKIRKYPILTRQVVHDEL